MDTTFFYAKEHTASGTQYVRFTRRDSRNAWVNAGSMRFAVRSNNTDLARYLRPKGLVVTWSYEDGVSYMNIRA
jgi:hypothetical protein